MSTQGNNLHFFSQQKKKKVRVVLGKVMERLNEDKLLQAGNVAQRHFLGIEEDIASLVIGSRK